MKTKKIITKMVSLLVIASMTMGLSGCGNQTKEITADKFCKASEKIEGTQIELDDIADIDSDDLEDGIYLTATIDDIAEFLDDELDMDLDDAQDSLDSIADMADADIDFDLEDDVQDASAYIRVNDDDKDIMIAATINFTDSDIPADMFSNIDELQDYIDDEVDAANDILEDADVDREIEFNLEDLGSKYYKVGRDSGYLYLNVNCADLMENWGDDMEEACDEIDVDFDDQMDDVENMVVSAAIFYSGSSMTFIVFANGDGETDTLDTFCSTLGVTSPASLDSNTDLLAAYMLATLSGESGSIDYATAILE